MTASSSATDPNAPGPIAAPPFLVAANVFGISFSLSGVAQAWTTATDLMGVPAWPSDVLWVLAAAVWLVSVAGYLWRVIAGRRLRAEFVNPTFAPFLSLAVIVPMLLGVALAKQQRTAGEIVFLVALVLTILFGGWISGQWILQDIQLPQWHPGYFLPTVAGGLLAAGGSATFGWDSLARLMFGYGIVCWLVLGSILLTRLFTQPALPLPLLPTVAIEIAPPVVAGSAWFAINGGRLDTVALMLAGYGLVMALVQLRLIPAYRRVPFGPGVWAFGFSYAAAITLGIHWLAVEHTHGQRGLTYALLAIITVPIAALSARTTVRILRGTFFPR
jgi:tellurite resistance protein